MPFVLGKEKAVNKQNPGKIFFYNSYDMYHGYMLNRPDILRRVPLFDFVVQMGGIAFFVIFCIAFIVPFTSFFGVSFLSIFGYGFFLTVIYFLIFSIQRLITKTFCIPLEFNTDETKQTGAKK